MILIYSIYHWFISPLVCRLLDSEWRLWPQREAVHSMPVYLCLCVCMWKWKLHRLFTMACGPWKEVRDMVAVSTLFRLLPLCPSASQHPDVPSRATTATGQTPRLPMSVYLNGKVKTMHTLRYTLLYPWLFPKRWSIIYSSVALWVYG